MLREHPYFRLPAVPDVRHREVPETQCWRFGLLMSLQMLPQLGLRSLSIRSVSSRFAALRLMIASTLRPEVFVCA